MFSQPSRYSSALAAIASKAGKHSRLPTLFPALDHDRFMSCLPVDPLFFLAGKNGMDFNTHLTIITSTRRRIVSGFPVMSPSPALDPSCLLAALERVLSVASQIERESPERSLSMDFSAL